MSSNGNVCFLHLFQVEVWLTSPLVAGRAAVKIFAAASDPINEVPLPRSFRVAVRTHQRLVPTAGTTSIELSRHILSNHDGKARCSSDWLRTTRSEKETKDVRENKVHGKYFEDDEAMTCGCSWDGGIWELFVWKTWKGRQGDEMERMPHLSVRERLFVMQNISEMTGMEISDWFCEVGEDWHDDAHQITITKRLTAAAERRALMLTS